MTPRLVEAVGVLRRLEFFAGDLRTDDELAAYLAAEHQDLWGEPLDRPPPELDWRVAAYDESRVWWEDTEADVLAGNDAYAKVIRGTPQRCRSQRCAGGRPTACKAGALAN